MTDHRYAVARTKQFTSLYRFLPACLSPFTSFTPFILGPFILAILAFIPCSSLQAASASTLSANTDVAIEGYFVLSWELPADDNAGYELQQADNPGFRNATSTVIPASGDITLSGFPDGDYYFRAGINSGNGGNWTETVNVTVAHPSLARALLFFLLGLALFIVLVTTIIMGNYRHVTPEPGVPND